MIALLAVAFFAPSQVVELVEPNARKISIQALVKMPILGAKDMAKLDIVVEAIPKQTEVYSRREMLVVTNGEPVRSNITPDHIRFIVNVAPGNLKAGLSLMESLVKTATLTQENLDVAAQELTTPDYWGAALKPTISPIVKLSQDEAQQLYHRVFRPERILLAVGGNIVPAQAQDLWESRMEAWNPGREPRGYFDITPPQDRERSPSGVTTIDFAGSPVLAGDAGLSSKILALFALGTGKGSSLFRIVREKHAWSYRQESILSPSMDGWIPRLLIACIPADDIPARVDTIRADLLDDVKSWTPAIRDRALGMARAVFELQVDFSPLYLLGSSPLGNTLEDRTFLAGYWTLKTGKPWDAQALLDSMKQVSLEDLKQQATDIVANAKVRVIQGG